MALPNQDLTQSTSRDVGTESNIPTLLKNAASADHQQRPDRRTVTTALLSQERQAKKNGPVIGSDDIVGTWQLRFTAAKKPTYKSGQPTSHGVFVPAVVRATLQFTQEADRPTGLGIQNQLQLGMLKLRFNGPAKILPQKNLLAFNFERLQILFGHLVVFSLPLRAGRSGAPAFETVPVGELPFFAFFAFTEDYIAARGRGGGLALWGQIP